MQNFEFIKLEKDMYKVGNLTDVLESIDSSESYYGTSLQELDAFSRQLKRYDIKVSGSNSDTVEKFFTNKDTAILFPEYVRRCVQMGIEENNAVQDVIANTIDIDGLDYRSVCGEQKYKHNSLSEGELRSILNVSTQDNLVPIHKYGKYLNTSYESLRFQRISTLTVLLKRIGGYIAKCQYCDVVGVLSNCGYSVLNSYDNIVDDFAAWQNVGDGYKLTTILCSPTAFDLLRDLLKDLIVFRDGNFYCGGAKIITSPNEPCCRIIGMDARYAVEMIKCDSIKLDYEKLIDRQFENVEIYTKAGFSILNPDAVVSVKW